MVGQADGLAEDPGAKISILFPDLVP